MRSLIACSSATTQRSVYLLVVRVMQGNSLLLRIGGAKLPRGLDDRQFLRIVRSTSPIEAIAMFRTDEDDGGFVPRLIVATHSRA